MSTLSIAKSRNLESVTPKKGSAKSNATARRKVPSTAATPKKPLRSVELKAERVAATKTGCIREFDAMQTYPREQLATGAHIGDYTQSCMEAHGYDWNLTDKRCQVTTTVERNPYCYNSLDRLLYLIEEGEFSK